MSIATWALLGFAAWTVLLLLFTVGVYRWTRILSGRIPIREFVANGDGSDWYKRAMRAHANCVENLPVFGAIVFAIHVSATQGILIDVFAPLVLVARVMQSLTHVCFEQSNTLTSIRFAFFFTQIISFFVLIWAVVSHALAG